MRAWNRENLQKCSLLCLPEWQREQLHPSHLRSSLERFLLAQPDDLDGLQRLQLDRHWL